MMSYDRKTKLSKNHEKPSKPKLVLRVLPGYLEGRELQNRKIEKTKKTSIFYKKNPGSAVPGWRPIQLSEWPPPARSQENKQ